MKTYATIMALTAVLTAGATAGAFERPRDQYVKVPHKHARHHDGYRYIRVESDNHPRTVIVPVRETPMGRQVKLPDGGSWVYCEITCDYTVRRQSLDFWEGQGSGIVSPGYFRRDFYIGR
jgi:hypothetical protein